MRLGARGALGAIGAILVVADAHAQTPAEISLADAVTIALEREPSQHVARAERDAARGMRQQAGFRPNPSLLIERREEPAGTDNQTMVQLTLPLDLFRRPARIAAADREVEIADRSADDRTRMLVNDVKMRYGAAAAAVRQVAVAETLASATRRELELLRGRVNEGASPPIDRDRLEVEVQRFEAARIRAQVRVELAMLSLKRALGLPADAPLRLQQTLETLATVPAAAETETGVRADIVEVEARARLSDARLDQARADGRIDVSVFGSYVRMDAGFSQRGFGAAGDLERVRGVFHYASGGVMVMLPLWNRNQGAIAAAQAEQTAAAARLDAARLTAQAEVAAARAAVTQTRQALRLIAGGVRLARQNLDIVRQTYELGRGTLSDVLTEQRRYLEIEQEYASALQEAFEARASLEFARGDLR